MYGVDMHCRILTKKFGNVSRELLYLPYKNILINEGCKNIDIVDASQTGRMVVWRKHKFCSTECVSLQPPLSVY
jgi:hypothetical protein